MSLCYQHEVYEGCGDYTSIDIEEETPEAFAAEIVKYEAMSSRFKYNPTDRLYVKSEPTPEVVEQINGLLAGAREARDRAKAEEDAAKKLRARADALKREIGELQSELDRWRGELTPEAIESREKKLKALRAKAAPQPEGEPTMHAHCVADETRALRARLVEVERERDEAIETREAALNDRARLLQRREEDRDVLAGLRLAAQTNRAEIAALQRERDALREHLVAGADVLEALLVVLRAEAPGTRLNNQRFDALGLSANRTLERLRAALSEK